MSSHTRPLTVRLRAHWGMLSALLMMAIAVLPAAAQVSVTTQHNDNARTGANLSETVLNTSNVNATAFGKLFTVTVDGEVYAQPLYVPQLTIAGGTHNIVYVATMNDSIYALDADNGAQLWKTNYGTPITASNVQCCCTDVSLYIGILGTPVIDPSTGTIYFVSRNENADGTYHQYLNALDITTGAARTNSPKEITGTYKGITFDPKLQNQRTALTLANGNIYLAWSSHNDCGAYHGWVMAYSASTLAQTASWLDTPTGTIGGIWMAGQGLTVDGSGNVYVSTGNGSFAADTTGANVGNSFVKLSPGLTQMDWFTPFNSASLNSGDQDLGSAGLLGLPGTTDIVGGGKQGLLYVVNTASMGKYSASSDNVVQEFQAVHGTGSSHIHGAPIYYNSPVTGPTIYIWGENDYLRAYAFNASTGLFNTTAVLTSTMTAPMTNASSAMPGGFLSLSANGTQAGTAIIWASTPYNANANNNVVPGVFHAFDAATMREIWNDKTNDARDDIGRFAKFCAPTVANGKVYLPNFGPTGAANGSGQLVVYGLLAPSSTAKSVSVGADGYSRVLWDKSDGTASVWKISAQGTVATQPQFGPYTGWTARAVATGKDNQTRLLWTNTNGTAAYYMLDADGNFVSQKQYGPYTGWNAVGLTMEPDNTVRTLWTNSDGTATVWTLDSSNTFVSQQQYGPYTGWTANSLTANPDGTERLLWDNTNGTATFWKLSSGSQLLDQHQYGPYTGYTATSIAAAPDGTGRVVWTAADAHIALWNIDSDNLYTAQNQYGPYTNWSYQAISVGSDGNARLLWDNLTGQAALWSLTSSGQFATNFQFGP
jgi:outer membrane protein assembly factor BamB